MSSEKITYDLDALVETYNIDNLYEQYKREEFLAKLAQHRPIADASVLELGSASGQMTLLLAGMAREVVAVDGSAEFIRIASARTREAHNVSFIESYFESIRLDRRFDVLVMHHILEHIEQPLELLPKLRELMLDDGLIAISVPNAHALSRQLAVKMGLLESVYALTDNDRHHGHFRVYDWQTLEQQLRDSGFEIVGRHGLSFKLLSDGQNIQMLNAGIMGEAQIHGLWALGDEYPQLAGAIMLVARKA
jgi:2-polyprenyl-3-methyl-5-hydroxy-6-metoxy-1,4-benzoquinol methylase